jgi:hypothetical protein
MPPVRISATNTTVTPIQIARRRRCRLISLCSAGSSLLAAMRTPHIDSNPPIGMIGTSSRGGGCSPSVFCVPSSTEPSWLTERARKRWWGRPRSDLHRRNCACVSRGHVARKLLIPSRVRGPKRMVRMSVVAQCELSPKLATQVLVSAAKHLADGELNDRSGHAESRFDLHVVADDAAATGMVKQAALVPPDPVRPTG